MWRISSGSSSTLPIHGVMPSSTPKMKLLASAPKWSCMKSANLARALAGRKRRSRGLTRRRSRRRRYWARLS